MSDNRLTRRDVLLGVGGLATTAVMAGCSAKPAGSLEPEVSAARLREHGWQLRERIKETTSETVEVAGATQRIDLKSIAKVFENDAPVVKLAHRFEADPATLDGALGEVFVAAKARMDPPVHQLFAVSETALVEVIDAAEDRVKRQLREQGFRNIRRVERSTLDIAAASSAPHRVYRADYPYESYEIEYRGTPVTVESDVFTVEAQSAVWPHRGLLTFGAGVYPGESGSLAVSTRQGSHTVDLEFEPERYRADVRGLIRSIA